MKETNPQTSILYILRPSRVPLALWKETVTIFKYPKSFQDSIPFPVRELRLADGEYICLELEEGYYQLKSKDMEKILYLAKNRIQYIDYFIFNESFFSFSERYFKELNPKEAIEFLIDARHLDRHPLSMD
ncbi:hypothetical protein AB3N59_11995 [Leptospira sp. WS92.C1]